MRYLRDAAQKSTAEAKNGRTSPPSRPHSVL
jgi:hypothetical protein